MDITEEIKQAIQEMDPCIKFDEENVDKLIGFAERFGGAIIPMYKDVNTFLVSDTEELEKTVGTYNSRALKADGFEDTLIGYMDIDGYHIFLHDREKMIDKMIEEYKSDPDCKEEEDYSYYTMALENYEFNIIGSYMEGVPAFAVLSPEA